MDSFFVTSADQWFPDGKTILFPFILLVYSIDPSEFFVFSHFKLSSLTSSNVGVLHLFPQLILAVSW